MEPYDFPRDSAAMVAHLRAAPEHADVDLADPQAAEAAVIMTAVDLLGKLSRADLGPSGAWDTLSINARRYLDSTALRPAPVAALWRRMAGVAAEDTGVTWVPVALGQGEPPAPVLPTIGRRSDGAALLYPGYTHTIAGPQSAMKTMFALMLVIQVIRDGGRVLYIDYENGQRGIEGRLYRFGATPEQLALVDYVEPDVSVLQPAAAAHFRDILTRQYTLAVIDGTSDSLDREGLKQNEGDDIVAWQRRIPKRVAASTGAATINIDHSPHTAKRPIGSQHKSSGLTGALLLAEPLSTGDDYTSVTISVGPKDRFHGIEKVMNADRVVAVATIRDQLDGTATFSIDPPEGHIRTTSERTNTRRRSEIEQALTLIEESMPDGMSGAALADALEIDKNRVSRMLDPLAKFNKVHRHGAGAKSRWRIGPDPAASPIRMPAMPDGAM